MANLMIAPQPRSINSAQSSQASATRTLPADAKLAGKSADQVKAEAKEASEDFNAKLKAGLAQEAKKDANKKVVAPVPQTAAEILAAQVQAQALAQAQAQQSQVAVQNPEGEKGAAKVDAKGKPIATTGKNAANPKAALLPASGAELLSAKNTESSATVSANAKAEVTAPAQNLKGAGNLSPMQQLMLQQQAVQAQPTGALVPASFAQQSDETDPELEHAFEIQSLTVGGAEAKNSALSGKDELASKRTPVSKVSTSDYLNLRELAKQNMPTAMTAGSQPSLDLGTALKKSNGKKDQLEALTGREAFAGAMASRMDSGFHGKVIDAPVTQGTAGKNILSHDAVHQMTQQVNLLSQARQDGEIKIRLRPDHLGELHMSVKAQGQQVSIEIKTQNTESKKIIEESLASLKESLASQNLSLGRVDVVSTPTQTQTAADQGAQFDMSQFRQNSNQSSGREFEQGNGRPDQYFEDSNAPVNLNTVRGSRASARSAQGLDLIA